MKESDKQLLHKKYTKKCNLTVKIKWWTDDGDHSNNGDDGDDSNNGDGQQKISELYQLPSSKTPATT